MPLIFDISLCELLSCRGNNEGKASRYTRCRRPTRLVYHEVVADRGEALRREAAIKALTRRQKLSLIRQAA